MQQVERFLDTMEAAAILGLKPVTLKIWRSQRKGPRYCKLGRRVLYPYSELMRWAEAQLRDTFDSPGEVRHDRG
jgi:predicted DNA-binding transcriptional regulator AlpA